MIRAGAELIPPFRLVYQLYKVTGFRSSVDYQVVIVYNIGMAEQLKTERVTIMMAPDELKIIDDWSFEQRIRSRGEAIRRLIELGLEAAKQKEVAR